MNAGGAQTGLCTGRGCRDHCVRQKVHGLSATDRLAVYGAAITLSSNCLEEDVLTHDGGMHNIAAMVVKEE